MSYNKADISVLVGQTLDVCYAEKDHRNQEAVYFGSSLKPRKVGAPLCERVYALYSFDGTSSIERVDGSLSDVVGCPILAVSEDVQEYRFFTAKGVVTIRWNHPVQFFELDGFCVLGV